MDESLDSWGGWNPVASFFHFSTRDVRWYRGTARDAVEAELAGKARTGPPPPPAVKRDPEAERLVLPRTKATGEFADVLLGRRTWRGFGSRPLPLAVFAQLLDLTWGVQAWRSGGENDPVAYKTSPSGGARHPIEAYVAVLKVEGVARGLYHYVADAGELELIRPDIAARQLERYLVGQWYYKPAAVVVFMTAVVARELWRYPNARSYRALFLEAGHLCQTFCLVATWLGLAPFCTAALDDARIERDLGVDGVNEVLIYAAGVGTRPAHGKWVQWPDHLPGHPSLPPRKVTRARSRARPRE